MSLLLSLFRISRLLSRYGCCSGGLLLEAVISVLVFSVVGTGVLSGLSIAHTSTALTEVQTTAEIVARSQMELVFSLPYQAPPYVYPAIEAPPKFSVSAVAEEYVAGVLDIETIAVTVLHGGREILVLDTVRARE